MTNPKLKEQLTIFPAAAAPAVPENTPDSEELTRVSFWELVQEIRDTGYLTHAIFAYPAKFIPQVVRYAIDTFTQAGDWIVDAFAGSGTVVFLLFARRSDRLVGAMTSLCVIRKRRCRFLHSIKKVEIDVVNFGLRRVGYIQTYPFALRQDKKPLREEKLCQKLDDMAQSTESFLPTWSNVTYWYPAAMLEVFSRYWGFIKSAGDCIYARIEVSPP